MTKAETQAIKPLGNEKSYSSEFFDELFNILDIEDHSLKVELEKQISVSARSYIRGYNFYDSLPPHKIKEELEKALQHIEKAESSLDKVFQSENFSNELVNGFYEQIKFHYPSLMGFLPEIRDEKHFGFNKTDAPTKTMQLLSVISDSIKRSLEYSRFRSFKKSNTLNHWVISIERLLEKIIGHKFQQSRYHKGEYISKREIGDSELLKFIIEPIDPNVTISQIETAIKETHKERHDQKIS
ncbi:MAG: hypothetical protein CBB87_05800 [Micavibrio sp. TMED27]|nr:hypothetical protein [Micavibrio sp.]OUT91531.1 MAG: hypothetical protein CBB87_05800 [Micavibrio sp. TMED27]|tara:strand:+ start:1391 stop:2113 length:723 start_codon:yes stop_codon:yes gene_type:complete